MSFGLGMQGLGDQITELVDDVRRRFDTLTYLEIGVANGETLCSIAKIISGNGKPWRAIGVELPDGYSFNRDQVEQNCTGQHFTVGWIKPVGWNYVNPVWNRVSVVLTDSRDFFEGMWKDELQLVLIDACHCKACVKREFIEVEKHLVPGGTVLMHDFEPDMHDVQRQGHGGVDVVGACKELGIMTKRDGWMLPRILAADKSRAGSNMLAVTREAK